MTDLPTKNDILDWIAENPGQSARRDIARAFDIRGAARTDLKALLRTLEAEGHLERRKKTYRDPDRLPPVSVLEIIGPDDQGDLIARPLEWRGKDPAPRIIMIARSGDPALGAGDRILSRLTLTEGEEKPYYEARLIRRIGANPRRILGIYRRQEAGGGGRILPIDKRQKDREWLVRRGADQNAHDGELVEAEQAGPPARFGLPQARILSRLGNPGAPRAVSLIATHEYGLPDSFSDAALAEAEHAAPIGAQGRTDLGDLPLITIDPPDARDHDDACCALPDPDPANPGGHIVWVAIADVAAYVTPGSSLDRDAARRGNATYFADRVIPMLPERLSGDLCSLHEGVVRPVIAVQMRIDAEGRKIAHRFCRGLIRSPAALHYDEVQDAIEGRPDARTAPLLDPVLRPLYNAYAALRIARARRQPLDLDLPERQIVLTRLGAVASVDFKARRDAHRLIEEIMVLANVAAAETLIAKRMPLLFRVHEEPAPEKLDALRKTAQAAGLSLTRGQGLRPSHLNRLLRQANDTKDGDLINHATLRAMNQAYYAPENFGHFGLALRAYAHFTSPIRRYSDLIVHRALITAHGWGEDGLSAADIERLDKIAQRISETERRSMAAERDTADRYLAAYLSERIGCVFDGRISGISRAGVFVKLDETGADGLVPMKTIGAEFFHYDRSSQSLTGAQSGLTIRPAQQVTVRLNEAAPFSGGILLELLSIEGRALSPLESARPRSARPRQPTTPRRKTARAKLKRKKR